MYWLCIFYASKTYFFLGYLLIVPLTFSYQNPVQFHRWKTLTFEYCTSTLALTPVQIQSIYCVNNTRFLHQEVFIQHFIYQCVYAILEWISYSHWFGGNVGFNIVFHRSTSLDIGNYVMFFYCKQVEMLLVQVHPQTWALYIHMASTRVQRANPLYLSECNCLLY